MSDLLLLSDGDSFCSLQNCSAVLGQVQSVRTFFDIDSTPAVPRRKVLYLVSLVAFAIVARLHEVIKMEAVGEEKTVHETVTTANIAPPPAATPEQLLDNLRLVVRCQVLAHVQL